MICEASKTLTPWQQIIPPLPSDSDVLLKSRRGFIKSSERGHVVTHRRPWPPQSARGAHGPPGMGIVGDKLTCLRDLCSWGVGR